MENTVKNCRRRGQMSEAFITAAFLSVSGGLQDAYTYIARGKVFANAQTGNVILLTQNLLNKNWSIAAHYLVPLVFFAVGVAMSDFIRDICKRTKIGIRAKSQSSIFRFSYNSNCNWLLYCVDNRRKLGKLVDVFRGKFTCIVWNVLWICCSNYFCTKNDEEK